MAMRFQRNTEGIRYGFAVAVIAVRRKRRKEHAAEMIFIMDDEFLLNKDWDEEFVR
jgi:adenine-specific DNA methylase